VRVSPELGELPAVSISSDDDTDGTEEWGREYDSVYVSDVDMRSEDDVDALDGVDLDSDVHMERDIKDRKQADEEEKDGQKEDENANNGKEHPTIGQEQMVNTSADDVDTMVNNQPIVLPEQGQKMSKHSPRPQPPAPAPWLQNPGVSPMATKSGYSSP